MDAAPDPAKLPGVQGVPFRHQRAQGGVTARFAPAPGGARPLALAQAAPLRLLLPDPEPDEWSVAALLNTGGGLAGGDAVHVRLALEAGARLTFATAAAEKVYRSLGPATRLDNAVELGGDAALEWVPQETILFDGAALHRRTEVALAGGARLLAVEMLVFGRAAGGEVVQRLALSDGWRVRRDGRLAWADTLRLDDAAALAEPFGLGGARALAMLLCAGPGAEALRDVARARLPGASAEGLRGGATRPAPGVMLVRLLGEPGALRAALAGLLPALRAEWLGQPARLPRLWTN